MSFQRRVASLFPPPGGAGAPRPSVYAVLDGARDERIYRQVYLSQLEYECLFAGDLSYELALAAPYLVRLTEDSPLCQWLLGEGWRESLGIFAWSFDGIEQLRRHFRRLLQVRDHTGKKLYFRFYDPRVLRVFLPTCRATELPEIFGPVTRFVLDGSSGQVTGYERGGRPLRVFEEGIFEDARVEG
jgi:hypothetical protein